MEHSDAVNRILARAAGGYGGSSKERLLLYGELKRALYNATSSSEEYEAAIQALTRLLAI